MEVKIGVQSAPRELSVDIDATAEEIEAQIGQSVADQSLLTLTDHRGRKVIVPGDKIAYVELGGGVSGAVGFRS